MSCCSRLRPGSATRWRSWCASRWATPTRWTCLSRSVWASAGAGTRRRISRRLAAPWRIRRPVSCHSVKDRRGRPRRIDAVGLLVLQREDPLVAEAAIDPVPHERQFHHLGGGSLARLACGSPADPCRLADRELAVADRAQPCRL